MRLVLGKRAAGFALLALVLAAAIFVALSSTWQTPTLSETNQSVPQPPQKTQAETVPLDPVPSMEVVEPEPSEVLVGEPDPAFLAVRPEHRPTGELGLGSANRPVSRLITLHVVDENLAAVPFANLEYAFVTYEAFETHGEANLRLSPATTDNLGQWKANAPGGTSLYVRIADPGWVCSSSDWRGRHGRAGAPDAALFGGLARPDVRLELRLIRAATFRLWVDYADGEPYSGPVRVASFSDAGRTELDRVPHEQPYTPGMTIRYNPNLWLRIGAEGMRGGYQATASANPAQSLLQSGACRMVIPEDASRTSPSGVVLEHTHFEPHDSIMVCRVSGDYVHERLVLRGSGETRSEEVPSARPFCWIGVGEGVVWTSGEIVLKPGEWRRVRVEPQPPARLSVRITDDAGNAVKGAAVSMAEVGYERRYGKGLSPDLKARLQIPADEAQVRYALTALSRAVSDSEGYARFGAVLPGKRRFLINAVGYEFASFEADLAAGDHVDHGELRLRRAKGTLTVSVVRASEDPAGELHVQVLIPGGPDYPERPVALNDEGVAVFRNVPAARYQVAASRKSGGWWYRIVTLEPGESGKITIDTTREPGWQKD